MEKIDYWFLDSAIENVIGFSWIVPNRTGDIGINREPLNISIDEMIEVMQGLFQQGNILAICPADLSFFYFEQKQKLSINLLSKKGFIPSKIQIKNALRQQEEDGVYDNEQLYYFLTEKGGELWEYLSNPSWNKYVNYEVGYETEKEDIEIIGINDVIITKFIELYHLFSHSSCSIYHPVLETQIWNKIIPFQCVYWKSFAQGYKVNCRIITEKVDRESVPKNSELLNQRREAKIWHRDITTWYTNYYLQ